MTFRPGVSGNPAGGKRGPRARQARIRKIIADSSVEIVESICKSAKAGDIAAQQMFCRYMLPRQRFVAMSVDLPVAQSAAEAQEQIAMLTVMAARGDLDLDALHTLSRSLTMAIDVRLSEIEGLLDERESEHAA